MVDGDAYMITGEQEVHVLKQGENITQLAKQIYGHKKFCQIHHPLQQHIRPGHDYSRNQTENTQTGKCRKIKAVKTNIKNRI